VNIVVNQLVIERVQQASVYPQPVLDASTPLSSDALDLAVPRVGYLIYRVERQLRTRLDEVMAANGVTTPQYIALSILRDRDGLSNAQLARWTYVTPQAMSLVLSALERRRLVRRRQDPRHRRVLRTSVTTRGLHVLHECDRAMDVIEADMLQGLDPATVQTLRAGLSSCAHSLQASRPLPQAPARRGARSVKLHPAAVAQSIQPKP
jgi:DNA-binding MarR family transcriptional regulator